MLQKKRSSVAFSLNAKFSFKIIIVGDKAVGKTSLVFKSVKGIYNKNYNMSIGVEFYSKIVSVQNEEVALQLWDTAGQQNFKSVVKSFYNKANCILIAYSNPQNVVKTIESYILQINEYALEAVRIVVVRTKSDEKNVTPQEQIYLNQLCKNGKIDLWMHTSSKEGYNVDQLFLKLGENLYKQYMQNEKFAEMCNPTKDSFLLQDKKKQYQESRRKKKTCC